MNIGIVGAGSWGTVLSILLANQGNQIDLWVYEKDLFEIINSRRENTYFLPGRSFPENIRPSNSLEEVVSEKEVILIVVPTHVFRPVLNELNPFLMENCLVVNASKGIENDTLSTIHEILKETIRVPFTPATISGPTFAVEIAGGVPSALVAAAESLKTAERVQRIFSNSRLRVFASTDLMGVELGGALKNVIAIATGISDGLQLGNNARAALITRGLIEITRIGTAMGARPETFSGLSGMGDLVLTCTGDLSRNRTVGLKLGRGMALKEITGNMKMVAEGIRTVKSAFALKKKLRIQAAVIDETYKVLYEDKSPQKALEDLMKVSISTEFAGVKGLQ